MSKVVSLTGKAPASDEEREFVEFFAQRLRVYVESYGHVPETCVFAMFGTAKDGDWNWGTCFMSPKAKSEVEACATAAGLLLRDRR